MKNWSTKKKVTIAVVLAALFLIGIFIPKPQVAETPQPVLTQQQTDSIAQAKALKTMFSSWDGSHHTLVKYITHNMNDPESFKHVETRHWVQGDSVIIKMTYRGKNAFGGVVTERVRAISDMEGNIYDVDPE